MIVLPVLKNIFQAQYTSEVPYHLEHF